MPKPQKGEKTPGSGRALGTPNKKTQSLLRMCEERNFNPFSAMLELAEFGEDDSIRMTALKEVCQYLYPKRKSLEHSGSIDPKLMEAAENIASMTKGEKIKLLEEELKELRK